MRKYELMKKSTVIMLAAAMMILAAGCAKQAAPETAAETTAATVEETAVAETQADTEETSEEDTGEASLDMTGGTPWINGDIKSNITADMKTSPKEDYYLYMNKDWLLTSEIPAGYTCDGAAVSVQQETDRRAKELLADETLTGHNAELIQGYYNKFLDWDARNKAGLEPIKEDIDKITALSSIADVSKFISSKEGYFYSQFLSVGCTPCFEDSSRYTFAMDQGSLLLGDAAEYAKRTSFGDKRYQAKKKAVVRTLVRLGYTESEAEALFDDVIDFEGKLAEACYTSDEMMAPDYYSRINNMITFEELKKASEVYPITEMLAGWGYPVSEDYMCFNPAYLKRVNELYTEDNLEQIKNNMLVKYIFTNMNSLDQEAYDDYYEAATAISGAQKPDDETAAYNCVYNALSEPMQQVYLDKYASEQMKKDITVLCEHVIAYYHNMLEEEDWIADSTRASAIKKLDTMKVNVAYPDYWYDYSNLDISQQSYFDAESEVALFDLERDCKRVNQKVNPDEWGVNVMDCNAFYNPSDNSINIMTGILAGDFYNEDMKEEEIYGGIGAVIGHEVSHAFDTNGAQFDENGNMTEWWTEEDKKNFEDRAAKLAAYFDKIVPYKGEHVRGVNVQTEAIADITGVKAMLAILSGKEDADYDAFFKAYAKSWAANNTPEREELILTQDVHPLDYLRVNVSVQQFDEFVKTYDVKEGDTMYLAPEDRILVW